MVTVHYVGNGVYYVVVESNKFDPETSCKDVVMFYFNQCRIKVFGGPRLNPYLHTHSHRYPTYIGAPAYHPPTPEM